MTKLSYEITTVDGKVLKADTYAEALKIMGENPGAKKKACYSPLPDPVKKLPLTEKQLAARVKAYK